MAARIDRTQVLRMDATGFSRTEIARRLKCSVKQLSRILGPAKKRTGKISDDSYLKEFFMNIENNAAVASRFGVSRQAIHQMKGQL